MRTLGAIESDLKQAQKDLEAVIEKVSKLTRERHKHIIVNNLYCTDLSDWDGKSINCVILFSDVDDWIITSDFEESDVIEGRLYLSDFERGVISFDEEKNSYYHYLYETKRELDIIGFIDIVER